MSGAARMRAPRTAFAGFGAMPATRAKIVAPATPSLSNRTGAARLITENPDPHRTAAPTFRAGEWAGLPMTFESESAADRQRWAPKGSESDLWDQLRALPWWAERMRGRNDLHVYFRSLAENYNRRREEEPASPRVRREVERFSAIGKVARDLREQIKGIPRLTSIETWNDRPLGLRSERHMDEFLDGLVEWCDRSQETLAALGGGTADNPKFSGKLRLARQTSGGADWRLVDDCFGLYTVGHDCSELYDPTIDGPVVGTHVADIAIAVQLYALGEDGYEEYLAARRAQGSSDHLLTLARFLSRLYQEKSRADRRCDDLEGQYIAIARRRPPAGEASPEDAEARREIWAEMGRLREQIDGYADRIKRGPGFVSTDDS